MLYNLSIRGLFQRQAIISSVLSHTYSRFSMLFSLSLMTTSHINILCRVLNAESVLTLVAESDSESYGSNDTCMLLQRSYIYHSDFIQSLLPDHASSCLEATVFLLNSSVIKISMSKLIIFAGRWQIAYISETDEDNI